MKKKHIALFTENLYGGGVEKIQQIILRNFDYEKYDVTLYSNRKEVLSKTFYPSNIKYKYIFASSSPNNTLNILGKIKNKIKLWVYYHCSPKVFYLLFIHQRYDVAIAFIEGYATRLVSGIPNSTKKIAWVHTDMENNHWTNVAYRDSNEEIKVYSNFHKIVCVSKIILEKFNRIFNLTNKTIIIKNPIERELIINLSKIPLNNNKNKIRLITLGSLIDIKGYDRLLRIGKRLVEDNTNYELLILGKGGNKEQLLEYIKNNKLEQFIYLVGYIENPYPYIAASDIYVCSSYAEGYNTAITEALILGKPVVSTECSGVKEQLGENNEYGICTPNTEEGLYEGIKQMLNNNTLAYYTQKAKERGKDFTLEASMNKIYQLIES